MPTISSMYPVLQEQYKGRSAPGTAEDLGAAQSGKKQIKVSYRMGPQPNQMLKICEYEDGTVETKPATDNDLERIQTAMGPRKSVINQP